LLLIPHSLGNRAICKLNRLQDEFVHYLDVADLVGCHPAHWHASDYIGGPGEEFDVELGLGIKGVHEDVEEEGHDRGRGIKYSKPRIVSVSRQRHHDSVWHEKMKYSPERLARQPIHCCFQIDKSRTARFQ